MPLDKVTLIVHVREIPSRYLLPQKPAQGLPPLLDLVFEEPLLGRDAANVVVVLQVLLFALFTMVVGAEDVPGEQVVGIPDAGESGVELREKRPRRPAEDMEEGAVHGGQPGVRIAFVEDDDGVGVSGEEFLGEEGTGDVEDALKIAIHFSTRSNEGKVIGANARQSLGRLDRVPLYPMVCLGRGIWRVELGSIMACGRG